jgi:signal transduction histidine kinase
MFRLPLSSLRVRLLLLVLVALLPAFGLVVYNGLQRRDDNRAAAADDAAQFTQFIASRQGSVIDDAEALLAQVANAPQVNGGDPASCNAYLASVQKVEQQYIGLSLASLSGDVACSSVTLSGPVNLADREYFQQVLRTREFATGEYLIARVLNVPTLPFAYPLLDADGEVTGVLVTALDLAWLDDFVDDVALPEGGALLVIDRKGVVLTRHPDPEVWQGTDASATPLAKEILAREEGTVETEGLDGVRRLFSFAPLAGPDGGGYVAVGVSTDAAFGTADATLQRSLALLGVVAALTVGAAWFGSGMAVLSPVLGVVRATERLRLGDLGARTGLAHDRGELGQLARAFDEMSTTLEIREGEHARDERALALQARELASQGQALARVNADLAAHAQDLARSNADLEQFAYVASHDLQEPLRMVANYTQLLGKRYKGKLDQDADDFIDYAVEGATRMQRLIEDLLAFSRVETRGKDLAPASCEDVLDRSMANLATLVQETGAVVTHDGLPTVQGDEGQLGQVFQNLIANGIRFRGDEPPRVHVSAARAGDEWTISVRDNGIGIEPQYAERIFVIFQRLHTRAEYPGTGIGLAVCKRIVERHGGRIWVESDGSHGSTFLFTLRAADVLAAQQEEKLDEPVATR